MTGVGSPPSKSLLSPLDTKMRRLDPGLPFQTLAAYAKPVGKKSRSRSRSTAIALWVIIGFGKLRLQFAVGSQLEHPDQSILAVRLVVASV